MSRSDFEAILSPRLRPFFGLLAGLGAAGAAVLFAKDRLDSHIATVARAELKTDVAECAAAVKLVDLRVKTIEDDRAKSATSRTGMQKQIDGLVTDVAVLKATRR